SKKGNQWELASITFETKSTTINIRIDKAEGIWFYELLTQIKSGSKLNMKEVMENYESAGLEDFELFWDNKPMNQLHKAGLLMI
ncbi:MAG: radical SAM protein, partial [Sphingobacteriales bacterium]|nr:radical SAM protein [Sphingobacteriales bacterium]